MPKPQASLQGALGQQRGQREKKRGLPLLLPIPFSFLWLIKCFPSLPFSFEKTSHDVYCEIFSAYPHAVSLFRLGRHAPAVALLPGTWAVLLVSAVLSDDWAGRGSWHIDFAIVVLYPACALSCFGYPNTLRLPRLGRPGSVVVSAPRRSLDPEHFEVFSLADAADRV